MEGEVGARLASYRILRAVPLGERVGRNNMRPQGETFPSLFYNWADLATNHGRSIEIMKGLFSVSPSIFSCLISIPL